MSRYINADELIFIGLDNPDDDHLFEFVPREFIDNAPTADVVEVVHGEWIDNGLDSWDGSTYYFRQCNSCGYERDDCNPDYDTPYCPNCGARMDGEV